jgi:hypothetical protein
LHFASIDKTIKSLFNSVKIKIKTKMGKDKPSGLNNTILERVGGGAESNKEKERERAEKGGRESVAREVT